MTKQATVQARVEQGQKDTLQAIASRHRVSLGYIVREAIYEYIQAHAPNGVCPECGSCEVKIDSYFDQGSLSNFTDAHCADCGAEWEVD